MSARPRRETKAPRRLQNNQDRNAEVAAARTAARSRTKRQNQKQSVKPTYNHKQSVNWHLKMHNLVFWLF
jgi:hypothetical protein